MKDGREEEIRREREPLLRRKTAISYKTEEKTVLRGYNLSELAEEGYSFSDAMFVLFQGRIPTEPEEKMLKYEMGEFMEHSMSPSAASAIAVSAGPAELAGRGGGGRYDLRKRSWTRGGARVHDEQVSGASAQGGKNDRRNGQDAG